MIVPAPFPRTEATQRFQTYRHYLRSIAALAGVGHPLIDVVSVYPQLAARIAGLPGFRHRISAASDRQALKRSLTNAWGTELLLSLGGEYATEDELLRITNNWAAVQLYYVFYHATQALLVARGNPRPETHPKTQALFGDMWVTRPMDCAPWTLGYRATPLNVPDGHVVETKVTTVARPRNDVDHLNYVFKALSTTRLESLPQAEKTKREGKRKVLREQRNREEAQRVASGKRPRPVPTIQLPRLTVDEKAACQAGLRCYTIMDLLYRIRTRTNYADGLMFIEGPADESASNELNRDMRAIASTTMLLFEMYICQQVGVDVMKELAAEWLDRNMVSSAVGVGQRLPMVVGN